MSAELTLRQNAGGTGNAVKNAPLTHAELDQNFINLDNEIDLKAPLASPALTGVPTVNGQTILHAGNVATYVTPVVDNSAIVYSIALG